MEEYEKIEPPLLKIQNRNTQRAAVNHNSLNSFDNASNYSDDT